LSPRFTRLESGLCVVTDASSSLKTAAIGVFVGVGSRHEFETEHGLAHLIEHMAFKGTRRRNALDIAETIENVGGDLNAETSVEQTGYFAHVLGEDAPLALDLLADIYTDSQFDAEELKREKDVIIQEIGAVDDTPDDLVFDLVGSAAWPGEALGRPILGTRESVQSFDPAAIRGYLSRHYRAGTTMVVGAGAVEHERLVELAAERLDGLPPDATAALPPAKYRGGETLVKKPLEQTHVVVAFEGRGALADDHDAAYVFAAATGGGMSSRLFQEVREKRGLAYSIHAFHWGYAETGLFGFYAGSAASKAGEVVNAALDCLNEACEKLSEREIERAKAQMKVSTLTALESPMARIQQLARQTFTHGKPLTLDEMTARINAVSVADARRAGSAMLKSPPTVAAIGKVGKVVGAAGVARRLGQR
jgi:predicted Zn-dependent peptidase